MWTESEQKAFEWFKDNYDAEAALYGGPDSTIADIFSPMLDGFIEVKQLLPSARCGQFTATTAIYEECNAVMNGDWSEHNAKAFVLHHYSEKNVVGFITCEPDGFHFMSLMDFLNNYKFSWQSYGKKSGTGSLPIKYRDEVARVVDFVVEDKRAYVVDEALVGSYFWIEDREYFISDNDACYGEIRKCSGTKNITWLVEVGRIV